MVRRPAAPASPTPAGSDPGWPAPRPRPSPPSPGGAVAVTRRRGRRRRVRRLPTLAEVARGIQVAVRRRRMRRLPAAKRRRRRAAGGATEPGRVLPRRPAPRVRGRGRDLRQPRSFRSPSDAVAVAERLPRQVLDRRHRGRPRKPRRPFDQHRGPPRRFGEPDHREGRPAAGAGHPPAPADLAEGPAGRHAAEQRQAAAAEPEAVRLPRRIEGEDVDLPDGLRAVVGPEDADTARTGFDGAGGLDPAWSAPPAPANRPSAGGFIARPLVRKRVRQPPAAPSRNSLIPSSKRPAWRISHSQTTSTSQPSRRSFSSFSRSRPRLRSSLGFQ